MEKTLEITVYCVNIGKVINTRREVLEAPHNYTSVACCFKVGIRPLYLPLKNYIAIYKTPLNQKLRKNGLIRGCPGATRHVCAV